MHINRISVQHSLYKDASFCHHILFLFDETMRKTSVYHAPIKASTTILEGLLLKTILSRDSEEAELEMVLTTVV